MVKYNQKLGSWSASVCMRHPITKIPTSLRRDKLVSEKLAYQIENKLRQALLFKFQATVHPTWPQLLIEFEADLKNRDMSEKAKKTYVSCLKSAVGPEWDNKFVKDISGIDIKHIVKHKHPNFSESHRKSLRKFFNSIFEFAVLKGFVNANPTPKLKFKIGQKIETTLNQTQCRHFLKLARQQENEFYPVWFMALHTGMRSGELFSLKWQDVDFERGIIKINSSWRKDGGYLDYTKTGYDRIFPINKQLREFLIDLKVEALNEFVLPRIAQWENGEQSRILKKFLKANNLPEIRFHDLRATCATLLLTNGVSIAVVMNLLGWKQLKTANIYYRKSAVEIVGKTDVLNF